ncbi:hypothetical protein [Dehalobacter sp. DCM]
MNKKTAPALAGTGINGLAVVSAVISQQAIAEAARKLIKLFHTI